MFIFALQGLEAYVPIGAIVVFAGLFIVGNLIMTHMLGPRAQGDVKEIPFEPVS